MSRSATPPVRSSSASRRIGWLAIAVLLLAGAALPIVFLNDSIAAGATIPGRVVDAGPIASYTVDQPHALPADDVFVLRLADGSLFAPYAYPPGCFGRAQGCRIRWLTHALAGPPDGPRWYEGCGGAFWSPGGQKRFGPGPAPPGGDLDSFPVELRDGHVYVDTRRLQCPGPPCERVEQPVTSVMVTVTDAGFQPARLTIPANRPVFLILRNETSATQNWHLVGVANAADDRDRWGEFVPPWATGVFAAPDPDIHTPAVPARNGQTGVPFMVGKAGAYTFQSDGDPARLRGTLTAR